MDEKQMESIIEGILFTLERRWNHRVLQKH